MKIIGIDMAVQDRDAGICAAEFAATGPIQITYASPGHKTGALVEQLNTLMATAGPNLLLAIDAPLGWPVDMGNALSVHVAGARIALGKRLMFSRWTDRYVRSRPRQQPPLEVGANLIARVAHRACEVLESLRKTQSVPLAWDPPTTHQGRWAIEVYPGGLLRHLNIGNTSGTAREALSYKSKKDAGRPARKRVLDALLSQEELVLGDTVDRDLMETNPDVLDAAICVLAGADFLRGRCTSWSEEGPQKVVKPAGDDMQNVQREGWIWLRRPD